METISGLVEHLTVYTSAPIALDCGCLDQEADHIAYLPAPPGSSTVDNIVWLALIPKNAEMSTDLNVHQRVAIGVTSGLLILTTFVVYLRLYIRCILLKAGSAGYDDLTVFIAWVSPAPFSVWDENRHMHVLTLRPDHGGQRVHSHIFR